MATAHPPQTPKPTPAPTAAPPVVHKGNVVQIDVVGRERNVYFQLAGSKTRFCLMSDRGFFPEMVRVLHFAATNDWTVTAEESDLQTPEPPAGGIQGPSYRYVARIYANRN